MRTAARLAAFAAAAALIAAPAGAAADTYAPPAGQVFEGINDTARLRDFNDFSALVGKPHLPIVQAFHTWGTNPAEALARWRRYGVRGVLSISTAPGFGLSGRISPREIAEGDGDDYLLTLNAQLAKTDAITYLRPLAEPNNGHNAYSAYDSYGSSRGADFSQGWYRQAWRRMVTIVRGGASRDEIDARLAAIGLPPIQKVGSHDVPDSLAAPKVAFIWCPLAYSGSPNIRGERAAKYWPGSGYVDWVGTDTYSKYPAFASLNAHYRMFRGKPFAIGEWGIEDADSPAFVDRLFTWQRKHPRVRMMIYHMSFDGRSGPLSLYRYPGAAAATRFQIRSPLAYPAYAPEWLP